MPKLTFLCRTQRGDVEILLNFSELGYRVVRNSAPREFSLFDEKTWIRLPSYPISSLAGSCRSAINTKVACEKNPTCRDATTGFPLKWLVRLSEGRLKEVSLAAWSIRSHYRDLVSDTGHQYGNFAVVPQTSFRGHCPMIESRNVGRFLGIPYLFY